MTQNERELLIKDLCARVPYNVKVSFRSNRTHVIKSIHPSGLIITNDSVTKAITTTDVENTKPYLFPMSSMTEEQLKSFDGVFLPNGHVVASDLGIDYLNSIHVDYRGLIPMGLALDATGKDIY